MAAPHMRALLAFFCATRLPSLALSLCRCVSLRPLLAATPLPFYDVVRFCVAAGHTDVRRGNTKGGRATVRDSTDLTSTAT